FFWVVDPLDGTTNFIHDLAPYCVCIALKNKTDILLGVVYEVTRKELYSAGKGLGAYLNGQPIHVSELKDLDQALVMIGYPYNAEGFRQFCLNLTGQIYGHCASIRSNGSAEGELCYLAAGKIDVYVESFIQPWDVMAGACILLEAGGKISDYDGADEQWESGRQVVATNGLLHEAMLVEIQKARS
ncbi:MAG: inositol monophosphatase, partial [Bacteroidaceae bacterium]|nr:inositol monophosphatase [Bacteroidaceae bacterium]